MERTLYILCHFKVQGFKWVLFFCLHIYWHCINHSHRVYIFLKEKRHDCSLTFLSKKVVHISCIETFPPEWMVGQKLTTWFIFVLNVHILWICGITNSSKFSHEWVYSFYFHSKEISFSFMMTVGERQWIMLIKPRDFISQTQQLFLTYMAHTLRDVI